jgi:hypothetical protein
MNPAEKTVAAHTRESGAALISMYSIFGEKSTRINTYISENKATTTLPWENLFFLKYLPEQKPQHMDDNRNLVRTWFLGKLNFPRRYFPTKFIPHMSGH